MLPNFKLALAARGKKQVDLAFEVRVPPDHLSRVINGRARAGPPLRRRLAEALGVDEDWLFSTSVEIPPASDDVKDKDE